MHDHKDILSSLEDDLDKELQSMSEQLVEEPVEEQVPVSVEENLRDEILKHLLQHPSAPSEEDIKSWKAKFGENGLQVSAFDSENVYVYTHLTVSQWDKVTALRKKMASVAVAEQEVTEKRVKEAVLKSCVLWPKLDDEFFKTCRAGLPDTLFDLIMINSYFLTPQQALTLTTKL